MSRGVFLSFLFGFALVRLFLLSLGQISRSMFQSRISLLDICVLHSQIEMSILATLKSCKFCHYLFFPLFPLILPNNALIPL
jgi:hypothetical protein